MGLRRKIKVQFLGQIMHKIICEMISNYVKRDIVIKYKGHQFYGPLELFSKPSPPPLLPTLETA